MIGFGVVLLCGCVPDDDDAAAATTLAPVSSVTIAAVPTPTQFTLGTLAPAIETTTTVAGALSRDAELAVRRCLQALGDDFMPFTLMGRDRTSANHASELCDEAIVQLQVEDGSELVTALLEQLDGARRSLGLVLLADRVREEDAQSLVVTLDGYVTRIMARLDES